MGAAPCLVQRAARDRATAASSVPRAGERLFHPIMGLSAAVDQWEEGLGEIRGVLAGLTSLVASLPQSHSACQTAELLSDRDA